MNIKLELLKNGIFEAMEEHLSDLEIDADKIADTVAIKTLAEIQEIIGDDGLSDFDAIEKIVCVFEKYNLRTGGRHDF